MSKKLPSRSLRVSHEERLFCALDAVPESICGLDGSGHFTFCNQAFLSMLGYELEEVVAKHAHDLLHRGLAALNTPASADCFLRKLLKSGQAAHASGELVFRKDETSLPAECWLRPLKNPRGVTTALLTIRDLTFEVRGPNAREHRKENLEKLLANVPDVAWTTNERGHTIYISPKVEAVLGYSPEQIYGGGPSLWLGRIHEEDCERVRTAFAALFERDGIFDEEYRIRRKDESWIWVHDRATTTREEDGKIFADGIFSDITSRKRSEDSLQQLSLAVEQSPVSVIITDPKGEISYANRKFTEVTGYASDEVIGQNPRILQSGQTPRDVYRALWSELTQGREWHGEFCNKKKNGEIYWDAVRITPVTNNRGAITHYVSIQEDVTARKQAEKQLRIAQFSVEHASDAAFWINQEAKILYANRTACDTLGYSREELVQFCIPDIAPDFPKDKWPDFWRELKQKTQMTFESKHKTKQGKTYPVEVTVNYREFDGEEYCFSFVRDITLRKLAEKQVESLAYFDVLTGLPNRMLLRDRLTQSLAAARRDNHKLAIIFVDLDRFKFINDTLGHSAGDLVLQEATRRLTRNVREQDTVARLGGDEFVILLNNIKDVRSATSAAERFMEAMAPDFQIQGHSISVSCSLGISLYPEDGMDCESLIKNADTAMYCAKEGGRNRFQIFSPEINAQAVERLTLERGLRLALEHKQFFLVYQPQVEITSGKIVGLEALLRWRDPEVGLVPPDEFIRVAENCGLIIPIGEWVLRTACIQSRKWQEEGLSPIPIAVNVSAVQFRQEAFSKTIRNIFVQTGVDARYFELELTESQLLSNADVMFSMMQEIKKMGLKLSIDDFGTGYSSLSYLKQFPVSKLKIDRSFIRDVATNSDDAAITTAIISMAKSLNLKVIAEGVENEEQMSFLRERQCDEFQGYYFSKPLTVEEVTEKMRSENPTVRIQAAGKQA